MESDLIQIRLQSERSHSSKSLLLSQRGLISCFLCSMGLTSWRQVYWTWYGATVSSPLISTLMCIRIAPDTADLSVRLSVWREWDIALWHSFHLRETSTSIVSLTLTLSFALQTHPGYTKRPSLHSECALQWWSGPGSHRFHVWISASHAIWCRHPRPTHEPWCGRTSCGTRWKSWRIWLAWCISSKVH